MSKPIGVITGCSRGIGLAIAEKLEKQGFDIYAFASSPQSVPSSAKHFKWFFTDFSEIAAFKNTLESFPNDISVDVLVNNAGINRIKTIYSVDDTDYDTVMNINTKAPYMIIKALLPFMKRGSRIINISSIWSVNSKAGRSLYSTSKSALAGMTRALAVELAPSGILVNTVSPGFTKTDLTDSSLSVDEKADIERMIPLGRMAETKEIASLVGFLADSENTYITGQNIVIDGGFTIV